MTEITLTTDIRENTDTLWKEIGGFEAVGDWHPMLERVDICEDDGGTTRIARASDGTEQVEHLTQSDPRQHSYEYAMERSALPVRDYTGKFRIEPIGPAASRVIWSARFELADDGNGKTIESVRQFLRAGTENLRARFDEKHRYRSK